MQGGLLAHHTQAEHTHAPGVSLLLQQVLGGLVAGAALSLAKGAQAVATPVDLFDDRKVLDKGFNLIYEARDLELSQNQRDGLTQFRSDIAVTKSRVKESEARLDAELEPFIKKNYWCGREGGRAHATAAARASRVWARGPGAGLCVGH